MYRSAALAWKPGIEGAQVSLGELVAVPNPDDPCNFREVDGSEERTPPDPS